MPAEKVYCQYMAMAPSGAIESKPQIPIVDVRWNREGGYVQIATKAQDPVGGRWADDDLAIHVTDGFHVDLDRKNINDLIRNLRRARDQAFGRDE